MKWFRANIRHGARLALLALALQFGLSFGHFHAGVAQAAALAVQSVAAQADITRHARRRRSVCRAAGVRIMISTSTRARIVPSAPSSRWPARIVRRASGNAAAASRGFHIAPPTPNSTN